MRNFESERLKVNDLAGNPIEIAAVVVWRVVDTAEALFHVDNYDNFVHVQSESALRNMALSYPYDAHVEGEISLRSHTAEVAEHLKTEIQDRLSQAGVEVLEARISHLAYAPEIAHAMLQRQQASAVIAARQKIVEGAVGMVEMALADALAPEHRRAGQRQEGDDGQQPAGRALLRPRHPADPPASPTPCGAAAEAGAENLRVCGVDAAWTLRAPASPPAQRPRDVDLLPRPVAQEAAPQAATRNAAFAALAASRLVPGA